jgi:hypothetical protein
MAAAEEDFELAGRKFGAGSIVIAEGDRQALTRSLEEFGLSAWAVAAAPKARTHQLDVPRVGYVHSWTRTQDEGWWRAALDRYGVPYTYFADQKLRDGNLRAKYDVIVFPHVGGSSVSQVNGMAQTGKAPLPYKKTAETPNLGFLDSSDDIRGGMGLEGLAELAKFVREGGTLITEGSTAAIFPDYGLVADVAVEQPAQLFVRGSILRGRLADRLSPIAYGYGGSDLPVYFSQAPVLNAGGTAGRGAATPQNPNAGVGQIVTPNAVPQQLSPFETDDSRRDTEANGRPRAEDAAQVRERAQGGSAGREARPRVVIQFGQEPRDLLLSGTLANGQFLANRAAVVDAKLGDGHVVMFAIRPFWRWQTHGTYTLGFNAIMNWNDLDAGRPATN